MICWRSATTAIKRAPPSSLRRCQCPTGTLRSAHRIELKGESLHKKRGGKEGASEFRLMLKHPSGFYAAGAEMGEALRLLSDGAFKIFVYVCLHADCRGCPFPFSCGGTGPDYWS